MDLFNGKMVNNILVVAPHPDDEVLGCGGTMAKLASEGHQVYVLVMSRGKKGLYADEGINKVRQEALNAHKILGVRETKFFDFEAPELDLISISILSTAIAEVIRNFNIDTVYLPHGGDIHHDHKAVYNAGLVAARPVKDSPVKKIYAYETLSETEWAAPNGNEVFIPTCFTDIARFFDRKTEAMKCFTTQLREFPNPRSIRTIEALANFRGSTVGFTHAESFMIVRIIEN